MSVSDRSKVAVARRRSGIGPTPPAQLEWGRLNLVRSSAGASAVKNWPNGLVVPGKRGFSALQAGK